MLHHAHRLTSWFIPRSAILAAVALAAAFVVVWGGTAHAQQPGQRPDFRVTQATFDGRNLHVEYINATGIGYPARRYEVGFQWYDATGQPIGVRHWLPVPAVERGGVSILDNRSRTELSYRSGRNVYGKRLSRFIEERPSRATELRVTVDDGDRIAEEDERNNVAALKIPLPDIVLRDVKLTSDTLTFTYANPTDTSVPGSFRIALQWMTPDGLPAGSEFSTQVGLTEPKEARQFPRHARELIYAGSGNRQEYQYVGDFVRKRQSNAEVLRITIDPENAIVESNETNNTETVTPAPPPKPDLTIETITIDKDGQPHATVWNRGAGATSSVVVAHEYRDRAGKRLERGSGSRETAPLGLGPDQKIIAALLGPIPDTAVTVAVTVDPKNAVAETDEQNNAKDGPAPMADLLVVEAKPDNGTLALTYRNAGERKADPLSIWLHFAGAQGTQIGPLYWIDVSPIRAGGTQVLANETAFAVSSAGQVELAALFAAPPAGATHLKVLLDGPDRVVETNEGNNTAMLTMPVLPVPDLTVTDLKLGDRAIAWTLKNIGDTVSGKFHYSERIEWLYIDGTVANSWTTDTTTPMLRAGSVAPQDIKVEYDIPIAFFIPPQGAVKLRVTVDPTSTVSEKDEGNNSVEIAIPLHSPDLTVTDLVLGKGIITWKLKNVGDPVSGKFHYEEHIEWVDRSGKTLSKRVTDTATPILYARETPRDFKVEYGIPATFFTPPPGATRLRVWVDPTNDVFEQREDNNTTELSVARSDLALTDLTIGQGKITWKEKNLGDTVSGDFSYLTQIAWLDASGKVLSERSTQAATAEIRAGSVSDEELSTRFNIPAAFLTPPPGAVKLRVTVDTKGTVVEKDEENNAVEIAVPLPDLTVSDPKLIKDAITWKEKNLGDTASGNFSYLTQIAWLDASGKVLSERSTQTATAEMRAGSVSDEELSTRFNIPAAFLTPPPGAVKLRITIDPKDTVIEKDEGNNTVEVNVEAKLELPDLAFTNVFLVPPKRERLVIGFENKGKVAAPEFSWAMSWVDVAGKRVGTPYEGVVPALKPNWRFGVGSDVQELDPKGKPMPRGAWLHQPKPDGAARLEITIDPENAITESDEGNNRKTFDEWVPPKPTKQEKLADLRIADFTMDPIAPRAGERVWFIVRVENAGSAATGTQTATGITVDLAKREADRKLIGQFTASDIAPGKPFTHRWTKENYYGWVAVAGTHTIEVCADRAKVVPEADETNNCARKEVTVAATVDEQPKLPDLTIMDATLDTAALRFWYHNRGERATGPTISLWYEMVDAQGKRVGELRWITLHAAMQAKSKQQGNQLLDVATLDSERGKTTLGAFVNGAPPSATHLMLTIDGPNTHAESNEQNNSVLLMRSVVALPDLVVGDVAVRDGALRVTVRNVGRADAGVTDIWLMWFGAKGALSSSGAVDLPAIAAGKATTVVIPFDAQTEASRILRDPPKDGTRVRIFLDGSRKVAESNEDNNDAMLDRAKLPQHVESPKPLPDLAFTNIFLVPPQRERLVIGFENRGKAQSPTFTWRMAWVDAAGGRVGTPYEGAGPAFKPNWRIGYSSDDVYEQQGKPMPIGKWLVQRKPKGAVRLEFVIDPEDRIVESDEANNQQTFDGWPPKPVSSEEDEPAAPTVVEPKPEAGAPTQVDLVVEGVQVIPASPAAGSLPTFRATVRNRGGAPVGATTAWMTVDLESDDEPDAIPEEFSVGALAPGGTQLIEWRAAIEVTVGTHTIEACADTDEAVEEANEENNCARRTFTVKGSSAEAPPRAAVAGYRTTRPPTPFDALQALWSFILP